MPDLLVVRIAAVLDESPAGKAAAADLERLYTDLRRRYDALTDPAERARFDVEATREIETERARRRDELLARARTVAELLRVERGAKAVVDASVALAVEPDLDVTAELIGRL